MQETLTSSSSPAKPSQLDHIIAELDSKGYRNNAYADFVNEEAVKQFKVFIKRNEKHVDTDPDLRLFVDVLNKFRMTAQQVLDIQGESAIDRAAKVYEIYKDNYKILPLLQAVAIKVFNKYPHDNLRITRTNTKLQLSDVTIAPVQLMPKYPLLLADFIKYAPLDHPERDKAVALSAKFKDLLVKINEFQRTIDNSASLHHLQGGTLTKLQSLESLRDMLSSSQGPSPSTARMNAQLDSLKQTLIEYHANPKSFHPSQKAELLQQALDLFTDFNAKHHAKKSKEMLKDLSETERQDLMHLEKNLTTLADFLLTEMKEEMRQYSIKPRNYTTLQKEELVRRNAGLYSYFTSRLNVLISKEAEKNGFGEKERNEKQAVQTTLTDLLSIQQTLMKDVATETKTRRLSARFSNGMPAKQSKVHDANLTEIHAVYKNRVTRLVDESRTQTLNDQHTEVRFYQQETFTHDRTIQLIRSLSRVANTLIKRNFVGQLQQERLTELNVIAQQFSERVKNLKPDEVTQTRFIIGELTQVLLSLSDQKPDAREFRKLLKQQTSNESQHTLVNVWDDVVSAHLPYGDKAKGTAVEAQVVGDTVSVTAYLPKVSSQDKVENEAQQLMQAYSTTKKSLANLAQSVVPLQQVQDGQTIRFKVNVNKLLMPEVDQNLSLATRILNWFGIDADGERKRNETQQFILKALNGEMISIDLPEGKGKANVKLNITQTAATESAMQESTPTRLLKLVGIVSNEILINAADMRKYFNQQDKSLNVWLNNTQMELSLRESVGQFLIDSQLSVASRNALKDKRRELASFYRQLRGLVESNDASVDEVKVVIMQKERELAELHKKANAETRSKLESIKIKALREQINKALRTGEFINAEDKKRLQQLLYFMDVQQYYFSGDYKEPENRLMFSAMLSRSSEMAGILQVVDYKVNRDPNNKRAYDLLLLKAEQDPASRNIPLTLSDAKHKEYITTHLPVLQTRNAGFAARTKKLLFSLWQRIMPSVDTPTLGVSTSQKRKEASKLLIYKQIENPLLQQVLTQKSLEKLLQGQRPRILSIDQIAALNQLFPKNMLIDAAEFNRNYMTFLKLTEMPDLKSTFMDAQKFHNLVLSDFKPLTSISHNVNQKITMLQQSVDNLTTTPDARLVQAIGNEIVKEQKRLSDAINQLEKWRAELDISGLDSNKLRTFIGDKKFIAYQQLQSEIDQELSQLSDVSNKLTVLSKQMADLLTKYLAADMSPPKSDAPAFPRHTGETPSLPRKVPGVSEITEPTPDKRVEVSVHS